MALGGLPSNAPIPISEIVTSRGRLGGNADQSLSTSDITVSNSLINSFPAGDYLIFGIWDIQTPSADAYFQGVINVGGAEVAYAHSSSRKLSANQYGSSVMSTHYLGFGLAANTSVYLEIRNTSGNGGTNKANSSLVMVQLG